MFKQFQSFCLVKKITRHDDHSLCLAITRRGVGNLCFSPNGSFLLASGLDDLSTIVVFDWAIQSLVCRVSTGTARILVCRFSPSGNNFLQVSIRHKSFSLSLCFLCAFISSSSSF